MIFLGFRGFPTTAWLNVVHTETDQSSSGDTPDPLVSDECACKAMVSMVDLCRFGWIVYLKMMIFYIF